MDIVIGTDQPISIVETQQFKALLNYLNQTYPIPSRNTIRYDMVPEMV